MQTSAFDINIILNDLAIFDQAAAVSVIWEKIRNLSRKLLLFKINEIRMFSLHLIG